MVVEMPPPRLEGNRGGVETVARLRAGAGHASDEAAMR
jgi:hypothetical protein